MSHRYFQPHLTPIQLFNRATDPFLPAVRPHTFTVLEDLDQRGLTNHVLVITRCPMKTKERRAAERTEDLKVTLLFTYSGYRGSAFEPYPSTVAANSLGFMSAITSRRYRTVLYWRPLVPGLNDSPEHLDRAFELHGTPTPRCLPACFTVTRSPSITGLTGLPEPYDEPPAARSCPRRLSGGCCRLFAASTSLFRKTSCAVSLRPRSAGLQRAHRDPGDCATSVHWPSSTCCRQAHLRADCRHCVEVANALPEARDLAVVDITERAAIVTGLGSEQPRYYLQHALGFQVHDVRYPHRTRQHGRADVGWKEAGQDDGLDEP